MHGIGLLIILGIIVGSNNLAVALALGALGQSIRIWRVVAVFGLFEFLLPLVGIFLGLAASEWIERHLGWLSIALLLGVGLWITLSGIRDGESDEALARRATTWQGLLILSLILSIDNLIIGFSLGLQRADPYAIAITISVFSMIFTWLGIRIGDVSRRHWQRTAKIGAGILLMLVALAVWQGWL